MTAVVDFHALFEVVYVSLALGLLVAVTFSAILYGAIRSMDLRREGHGAAAAGLAFVAAVAATGLAAIVVYGFNVITTK